MHSLKKCGRIILNLGSALSAATFAVIGVALVLSATGAWGTAAGPTTWPTAVYVATQFFRGLAVGTVVPPPPVYDIETFTTQDAVTANRVRNLNDAGLSAQARFEALGSTAQIIMSAHGAGRTAQRYGTALGNYSEIGVLNGAGLMIGTTTVAAPIIFGTNSTERMRIASTGEVTIGTISSDGTNKIVCIKSDGTLGTCTLTEGTPNTCTCA